MAFIFWFSSAGHDASTAQSDGVIGIIQATIGVELPEKLVRKSAHFFAYCVLGVLLTLTVRTYDVRWRKTILIAVAIACAYAISDEVHQLMVDGRSGQVSDVLLDTVAATAGAFAAYGVHRFRKKS